MVKQNSLPAFYRGCLDGWLEASIDYSYVGCKEQVVAGVLVNLCLCESHLCNGKPAKSFQQYLASDTRYVIESNDESETGNKMAQFSKEGKQTSDKYEVISLPEIYNYGTA